MKRKALITNKNVRVKKTSVRKNIVGSFRGSEDIFFIKVRDGLRKFLESPFK